MYKLKSKLKKYHHLSFSVKNSQIRKISIWAKVRIWAKILKKVFTKYSLRVVFAASLIILVFLLGKITIPLLPIFKNSLVIGVVGDYTSDNLPQSLSQLYSAGLTKFTLDSQVVPDLASWQTTDGKVFQFRLKDGLFWQDGQKLKASDLQFQLSNVQINVINDQTIDFVLVDTFSPFPSTLAKPVFRKNTQIGTGPYKLSKSTKNGQILRQIVLTPLKSDLPQITINFFPNSQIASQTFKTGQVGILFNLPRLNGLENWKSTKIIKTFDPTRLVAVFYNTQDGLLKNNKVRKALDISINRENFAQPVTSSLPPDSWVRVENEAEFNLEKAKKLLPAELATDSKIQVLTPTAFKSVISEIAVNWEKLGLKVEILEIDKIPSEFQAAIFGLEIPVDPDQYIFWHSTQSQALTKIEDPKLDKLLEDGRKSINLAERKQIYQNFQTELQSLVPASFLFFQDRYIVINKNSENKLGQIRKLFPEFPQN